MRKHVKILALLAAVLMAVSLAACSARAPAATSGRDMAGPQPAQAPASGEESAKGDGTGSALPALDIGDPAASGKKVIYTVDMALEAEDAAAAIKDIAATAASLGGYVADSQYAADTKNASSWVTVRIAPEKLDEFTAHVGTLGKVLKQNVSSQDITSQYSDLQLQLTSAQAEEAQYLEIMKRAETIDDTLKVRDRLDAVQREIERLKGQLRFWDSQVGFSTVTVRIQQPAPAAVTLDEDGKGVEFWGFAAVWQKISQGFVSGFNWTLNALSVLLMIIAYAILPLAVAGGITIGIIALMRTIRKGKKKQPAQKVS
jgi:hypothetical protein